MRQFLATLMLLSMLGCAGQIKYDPRLNGTWQSNREESVAYYFGQDPRLAKAPLEKVEQIKGIFGQLTVTYSNEVVSSRYHGTQEICTYIVRDQGEDYVVIRPNGGDRDGEDIHIQFVDGGRGYWITSTTKLFEIQLREKFEKLNTGPTRPVER